MYAGVLGIVGVGYSARTTPEVDITPILCFVSVNHRFPSGPLVSCPGDFIRPDSTVGIGVGPTEWPGRL